MRADWRVKRRRRRRRMRGLGWALAREHMEAKWKMQKESGRFQLACQADERAASRALWPPPPPPPLLLLLSNRE